MSNVFAWIRGSAAGCVLMIAASLVLAGCGSDDDNKNYVEQPVEVLYNRALDDLGAMNYKAAAKGFEEVDRQHPYSVWATKAQIMAAFAYYQSNKYDDAIVALDRFIQLHPGHRDIPYAYYLKGLCYYEQIADVGLTHDIVVQSGVPVIIQPGSHANDQMFSFYFKNPSGFMSEVGWGGRPSQAQIEYYEGDSFGHAPVPGSMKAFMVPA